MEEIYYNTDGENLINGVNHYAMIRYQYDPSGNLEETIYYDQDDEIPERTENEEIAEYPGGI